VRILTISDEIVQQIYCGGAQQRLHDVDMILSCGDLPQYYIEYFVSTLNVPCLCVPGNHDGKPTLSESGESRNDFAGCDNVDGRVRRIGDLTIAGLGGSPWYNGELYQYTEGQMRRRVVLLAARLAFWQSRMGRPLDIMMTHAAPLGIHDGPGPHRGFKAFGWLIEHFHPRYFIHGHVHPRYGYNRTVESVVGSTTVINTVGYRVLDIMPTVPKRHGRVTS